MWETRNSNTYSSETAENSKSVVKIGEAGNINKECHMKGRNGMRIHSFIHSYFYSPTKHVIQISNHNLLCSLDPSKQGWLFSVVGAYS